MHVATRNGLGSDLWSVVLRPGPLDENEVWEALKNEPLTDPDYRTRLLAHEVMVVLARRWGEGLLLRRLERLPTGRLLGELWGESLEEEGFPSLRSRIVQATTRQAILQLLRELGTRLRQPASVTVGGSTALLIADAIIRRTDHVDFIDELPEALRAQPELVDELAQRYDLRLAHFASHYVPEGWEIAPTHWAGSDGSTCGFSTPWTWHVENSSAGARRTWMI